MVDGGTDGVDAAHTLELEDTDKNSWSMAIKTKTNKLFLFGWRENINISNDFFTEVSFPTEPPVSSRKGGQIEKNNNNKVKL